MNSFRDFVRKHISRQTLVLLLGFGFISLATVGLNFKSNVGAMFADTDASIDPSIAIKLHNLNLPPPLPTTPPPSQEVPDRSFAEGENSSDVLLLQNFLKWRGFLPKEIEASGYFGATTVEALEKYQKSMKLPQEPIAGPLTRQAWGKDVGLVK